VKTFGYGNANISSRLISFVAWKGLILQKDMYISTPLVVRMIVVLIIHVCIFLQCLVSIYGQRNYMANKVISVTADILFYIILHM